MLAEYAGERLLRKGLTEMRIGLETFTNGRSGRVYYMFG